jgi:hypothetical protein
MNPKSASGSAAGSIYAKSSGSGSGASSFAASSDKAGPAKSGSRPAFIEGPMQKLIETFNVPAHQTHGDKISDLRVAYANILLFKIWYKR